MIMKSFNCFVLTFFVVVASLVNGAAITTPKLDVVAATAAANPPAWSFFNVTFFQASPGYGASYVRFFITNNVQRQNARENYTATCSSVAFPSDPVNGGTTPQTYTTGPLTGTCDNPNATWSWDGKQLQSTYHYASGQFDPSGKEYVCTVNGLAATNRTTLTTKSTSYGTAKVAKFIPVTDANAIC